MTLSPYSSLPPSLAYPSMTKSMSGPWASQSIRYSPFKKRVAPTCLASLEISFLGPVIREVPAERREGGREGVSVSERRDQTCLAGLEISC